MSANPINHPFYFCLAIDVIVTLSVDASRDLLDLSINGVTWTHLLNFPIWVVILVFATCGMLRGIFYSTKLTTAWTYIRKAKVRERAVALEDLPQYRQRPRTVRVNTDRSMFASMSPTRGITSATPVSANTAQNRFA